MSLQTELDELSEQAVKDARRVIYRREPRCVQLTGKQLLYGFGICVLIGVAVWAIVVEAFAL